MKYCEYAPCNIKVAQFVIYDRNDSGQYYKTMILANLASTMKLNYDRKALASFVNYDRKL